jgi:hypothetical protein
MAEKKEIDGFINTPMREVRLGMGNNRITSLNLDTEIFSRNASRLSVGNLSHFRRGQ